VYDIILLTDQRYLSNPENDPYISNILLEDELLTKALRQHQLSVFRTNWDDPEVDWTSTRFAMFRTTWDYFYRFNEFYPWFEATSVLTHFINSKDLVKWNFSKKYLLELEKNGVRIPPTVFIPQGTDTSLMQKVMATTWKEFILKPAVGGTARHTYRFLRDHSSRYEDLFAGLIQSEDMLLQEYLPDITVKGEVAFMIMGGKFTHAVLKKAKPGDFRVQDDFGGTLHDYEPTEEEIAFAESVVRRCPSLPLYARVDVMWDTLDRACVSELEIIEPELWFRRHPAAAYILAEKIVEYIKGI
jgi:glutathione synthase/RimK-type ligase-like ATP-grasp enzyme